MTSRTHGIGFLLAALAILVYAACTSFNLYFVAAILLAFGLGLVFIGAKS